MITKFIKTKLSDFKFWILQIQKKKKKKKKKKTHKKTHHKPTNLKKTKIFLNNI